MVYTEEFLKFWKLYPKGYRKDGHGAMLQGGKKNAMTAWRGLSAEEKRAAMVAVVMVEKHEYLPMASTWLNGGYYESLLEIEEWEKEQKTKKEQAYRQQKMAETRKEWSVWIKEQAAEKLQDFIKTKPHIKWLVREIRPEIFTSQPEG